MEGAFSFVEKLPKYGSWKDKEIKLKKEKQNNNKKNKPAILLKIKFIIFCILINTNCYTIIFLLFL